MKKNLGQKIIISFSVILIAIFSLYPSFQVAKADNLDVISDKISRAQKSIAANHTIVFTTPTGIDSGDTVTFTFAAGFDISAVVVGDVTIGGNAPASAVPVDQVLTITADADTTVAPAGTATIVIGNNHITNPGTTGSKLVVIDGDFGDDGSFALAIVDDDTVTVNAAVDPTITFTINGGGTVNLGTITTSALSIQNHTIATTTNAPSGYTTRIYENNELRSTATPGDTIDEVGDGTVNIGQEEYGMATSDAGNEITQDTGGGTTGEASAITVTPQSVATAGGAVSADTTTIYYKAAVSGLTVSHSDYTHEVTYVTTGNF